jgi:hypothetical protein
MYVKPVRTVNRILTFPKVKGNLEIPSTCAAS